MKQAKFIFLLACTFVFVKAHAAIHAGNITYSWIGPGAYTYQIKYTIYTDNVSPDNYCAIDSVCFGDGTRGSILRNNGPCSGSCSPAGCEGVVLTGGALKMSEYVTTHTYAGPGNYIICLEIPNRNAGIVNIPNSVNQVFYIESYLVIPFFGVGKNTSAVFANHPIASGCSNNGCFTYNPSATDINGDSLSYELVPSMCGACTGYTYPNAGAGGTFSINPVIGTLSWCNPQYNGDYNVGILIKEWRKDDDGNYFLIGYVERDTQFTISTCTGFKEQDDFEKEITVSPNPTTGYLLVGLPKENVSIILTDVCGKIFYSESNINSQSYSLDLENINQGIYFLSITGGNHTTIIKKIIKQ